MLKKKKWKNRFKINNFINTQVIFIRFVSVDRENKIFNLMYNMILWIR